MQAEYPAEFKLHSKVPASFEVKEKEALELPEGLGGVLVRVVSGATVSKSQL
jgi:hypothetical protein